jgi:hypothetical protein
MVFSQDFGNNNFRCGPGDVRHGGRQWRMEKHGENVDVLGSLEVQRSDPLHRGLDRCPYSMPFSHLPISPHFHKNVGRSSFFRQGEKILG